MKQFFSGAITNAVVPGKYSGPGFIVQSPTVKEGWGYDRAVSLEFSSFAEEGYTMDAATWAKVTDK